MNARYLFPVLLTLSSCSFDGSGQGDSASQASSGASGDPCADAMCPTDGLCDLVEGEAVCMCNDEEPPGAETCTDATTGGETTDSTDSTDSTSSTATSTGSTSGSTETDSETTTDATTTDATTTDATTTDATTDATTDDTTDATTDDSTTDATTDDSTTSTTGVMKLPDGADCDKDGQCESEYCYADKNPNLPLPTKQTCHGSCIEPSDPDHWCFEQDDCCAGWCNPLDGQCN